MTMPSLQALYCTVVLFKPVTDKEYFSTETIGINEHCVYKLFIIFGIYWYLLSRRGRKYRHSIFCQQRWTKKILDFPGINVTSSWLSLHSIRYVNVVQERFQEAYERNIKLWSVEMLNTTSLKLDGGSGCLIPELYLEAVISWDPNGVNLTR